MADTGKVRCLFSQFDPSFCPVYLTVQMDMAATRQPHRAPSKACFQGFRDNRTILWKEYVENPTPKMPPNTRGGHRQLFNRPFSSVLDVSGSSGEGMVNAVLGQDSLDLWSSCYHVTPVVGSKPTPGHLLLILFLTVLTENPSVLDGELVALFRNIGFALWVVLMFFVYLVVFAPSFGGH